MAHPSYEVDKTYVAAVDGQVYPRTIKQLLAGVELDDGPVAALSPPGWSAAGAATAAPSSSWSSTRVATGSSAGCSTTWGHPVRDLTRTAIGPVVLGRLGVGELHELTPDELGALLDAAELDVDLTSNCAT